MELQEAKDILNACKRSELRDHAFGDAEVYWEQDGKERASGYFGGGSANVSIEMADNPDFFDHFEGLEAKELRYCGAETHISRNDETGPITYVEGYIAPGLSLEDVRRELTGE